MDHETFFTVVDGDLVALERCDELTASLTSLLSSHIEALLGRPTLTLGTWEDSDTRPDVLALDTSGCLISIVFVNPTDLEGLADRIKQIEEWLKPLELRDLSLIGTDPVVFYEGLLDISPHASVTLSSPRRYVLVTALDNVETQSWGDDLPDTTIELQYFDVVQPAGVSAPVMKRRTPTLDDLARAERATNPLADVIDLNSAEHGGEQRIGPPDTVPITQGDAVSGDETTLFTPPEPVGSSSPIDAVDRFRDTAIGDTVDLTDGPPPPLSPTSALTISPAPEIRQGATFALDRLPLLFDPLGSDLTSISDELFAVGEHIVIVEKLPDRRRNSPFEDRGRFRWDTTHDRIRSLNEFGTTSDGSSRTIHLFVETERQGGHGVYIGTLSRVADKKISNDKTIWFSIQPRIEGDLYRLLRKGRIPQHIDNPTIDFGKLDV